MNYIEQMKKWAECVDILFEWTSKKGDPLNNMYPLLGLSRSSHIDYLNDTTPLPQYVLSHIDTLNVLSQHKDAFFELASERLLPDGYKKKSVEDIAKMVIGYWDGLAKTDIASGDAGCSNFNASGTPYEVTKKLIKLYQEEPTLAPLLFVIEKEASVLASRRYRENHADPYAYIKLNFLLKQPVVKTFKEEQVELLKKLVSPFREEIGEKDMAWLESLPIRLVMNASDSFDGFKKVQMAVGEHSSELPRYSKYIFTFTSTEQMAQQMFKLPNGFCMCLIVNKNPSDSFFVIAVKNGGNLTLMTDEPKYSNPMQASAMAARNDRYNEERHIKSLFPYDMLNIIWGDNGRKAILSSSSSLATIDDSLKVLGTVDNLRIDQLLWFAKIVELSYEKYFVNQAIEPKMALIDPRQVNHLWLDDKSVQRTDIVSANVEHSLVQKKSAKLTRDVLNSHYPRLAKHSFPSKWLEERYADKVDDGVLYLPQGTLAEETPLLLGGDGCHIEKRDISHIPWYSSEYDNLSRVSLVEMPSTSLMTVPESQATNDFIARYNQSKVIEQMAIAEYEQEKGNITQWFYKAVKKNLPNIIDDLICTNHEAFSIAAEYSDGLKYGLAGEGAVVRQVHVANKKAGTHCTAPEHVLEMITTLNLYDKRSWSTRCYLSKAEDPEFRFYLNVGNAYDISKITGVPVNKLPPQLQNYKLTSRNRPSLISGIVDPLDTVGNPWDSLDLYFTLPISKAAVNERRKAFKLKPLHGTKLPVNHWEVDWKDGVVNELSGAFDSLREHGLPKVIDVRKPSYSFRIG